MNKIRVSLIRSTQNPDLLAAAAAKGCFAEESCEQIEQQLLLLNEAEREKEIRKVLNNSIGRGHGSVGDQCDFTFSIENLPRLATLQLCLPEYLSHLQQSLRRVSASKGYYLSDAIEKLPLAQRARGVLDQSFNLYDEMVAGGIPAEDARFILPLATRTNITTKGDVRELVHLYRISNRPEVPFIVKMIVNKMMFQAESLAPTLFANCQKSYDPMSYRPAAQLFMRNELVNNIAGNLSIFQRNNSKAIPMDFSCPTFMGDSIKDAIRGNEAELANLKHIHFTFIVFASLAMFHQLIRQRTWNISCESIFDAIEDARDSVNLSEVSERMIIPPTIFKSVFLNKFKSQFENMLKIYFKLTEQIEQPEAVGVIPHALGICSLVHIDGWNAIGGIGQRTCTTAQWEIRNIATKMAEYIGEKQLQLGKWTRPKCFRLRSCPEGNKKCPNFGNWD